MLVKEVMNENILATTKEAIIKDIARTMTKNRIGGLLVLEETKLTGIITERDILSKLVARGEDPRIIRVDQIMTPNPITIQDDDTIDKAIELMTDNKIKKLPVMHEDRLVGILTASDIIEIKPKMIQALYKLIQATEQKMTAA